MHDGLIVKALSGYYYVLPDQDDGTVLRLRARGVFKKHGVTPLVGDRVRFERTAGHEDGRIVEVLDRTNELVRPPIANVDQAIVVFSLREPELHLTLLDRFLVQCESNDVDSIICLSKADLCTDEECQQICEETVKLYTAAGYPVVIASVKDGRGLNELRQYLEGKISVFAGQSGVGKSSLLNALIPGVELATGDVSRKLGRGRHTTRHVELLRAGERGFVADTPGFSQLDFFGMEAEDLSHCFREFREPATRCKFRGCLHREEPGCAIVEAVEQNLISELRYRNYLQFLTEIQEKKRRY